MDIKIQSIHFDATAQLQAFIEKKVNKLEKYCDEITSAEVVLKVVKPETSLNKEASIKLLVPRADDIYSQKIADTFEEAIDNAIDALVKQLQKNKEKTRGK
ncbi:MAG: ribosome-associated translation inhibitor RaiA [Bacteroidetes bacterium]|uniref:Ribosome-associated translation inhibitor RaiA n=1 Tax=Candidatus Caccoplasma merdipullorum TaxID=2840718 RepID=A0A9D9H7H8_9BACT|nr:ribosome-associated translation inhibitor RaiA [Candidatus Caccoplasma merdipullorum]